MSTEGRMQWGQRTCKENTTGRQIWLLAKECKHSQKPGEDEGEDEGDKGCPLDTRESTAYPVP